MLQPKPNLDDYANNMFRFERLHDTWLDQCAAYLKHVFGDRIKGATVLDYAFGRGNWSVAFIRAGAKRVVAVDASQSNVDRLSRYCAEHNVSGIDVICGNVMEKPIDIAADILWVYGIFPAIVEQAEFTRAMVSMAKQDALILAYGFDRHSLRECIVECAREGIAYTSEAAFRRDSLKYTPAGRMRARDDLTAPHVEWHTAEGLAALFAPLGFKPIRQFEDFRPHTYGYSDAEFSPHHLLLSREGTAIAPKEPNRPYAGDATIIRAMWDACMPHLSKAERADLGISLFSTHFSHLDAKGNPEQSLLQCFLLLYYALRSKDIDPATLPSLAGAMVSLAIEAQTDSPRRSVPQADAFLVRYLQKNTVRI